MNDGELLQSMGTDAQLWAQEWCRIASEIDIDPTRGPVIDEGWMIGWFANAIEAGRYAGREAIAKTTQNAVRPALWNCLVGHRGIDHDSLPRGCDAPMREAVARAFREVTGQDEEFIFSGWGQDYISESQSSVLDGRNVLLDDRHYSSWQEARRLVARAAGVDIDDDRHIDQRTTAAVSALTELLWFKGAKV